MRIASFPTLTLAGILAGPALWHGFVERDIDQTTALVRLLIAIPVAAAMLAFLRALTRDYGEASVPKRPLRVTAVAGKPLAGQRSTGRRPSEPAG